VVHEGPRAERSRLGQNRVREVPELAEPSADLSTVARTLLSCYSRVIGSDGLPSGGASGASRTDAEGSDHE